MSVTSVTLTANNPGTNSTPYEMSGSAGVLSANLLGVSKANSAQLVVRISTNASPDTPSVDRNGVVQLSVGGNSSTQQENFLLVQQSQALTADWSFTVQVQDSSGGGGGGSITFRKGTGGGGDRGPRK